MDKTQELLRTLQQAKATIVKLAYLACEIGTEEANMPFQEDGYAYQMNRTIESVVRPLWRIEKMEYQVIVQVEEIDDNGDWSKTIIPKHCPAVFDTIEEAETYCDDLMVGE